MHCYLTPKIFGDGGASVNVYLTAVLAFISQQKTRLVRQIDEQTKISK